MVEILKSDISELARVQNVRNKNLKFRTKHWACKTFRDQAETGRVTRVRHRHWPIRTGASGTPKTGFWRPPAVLD